MTVSVVCELDAEGKVLSRWFGRTLIRSARELYYEQGQALLNQAEREAGLPPSPDARFKDLDRLILGLRAFRPPGNILWSAG